MILTHQIQSSQSLQQLIQLISTQPPSIQELNLISPSSQRSISKLQISLIQKLIQLNSLNPPPTILPLLGLSINPSSSSTSTSQLNTLSIHSIHHILSTQPTHLTITSIQLITNLLHLSLNQFQLIHHHHFIFHHLHQQHQLVPSSSIHPWTTFINHYLSLPTKLSNLIYEIHQFNPSSAPIQILNHLQPNPFLSQISLQFHSLLKSLASTQNQLDSKQTIHSTTILLNKLINIGFVSSVTPHTINQPSTQQQQQPEKPCDFFTSIWPELIKHLSNHKQSHDNTESSYSQLWNATITRLPRTESKSFILSFLTHLQIYLAQLSSQHQQPEPFLTDATNDAIERLGAEILNSILGSWGCKNPSGSIDLYQLVIEILTDQTTHVWNTHLARSLARWSLIDGCREDGIKASQLLAKSTLTSFGAHHQIANGHASQQSFLLVLMLLTTLSNKLIGTQQRDQSCQSNYRVDGDLTLDPIFIISIQRSLNSIRSQFRLLGMLMAELLTEINQCSSIPSLSERGSRKKVDAKLDFGHDFEAFQDDENRLCVKIRDLCNTWNPSESDSLWLQVLSDSFNDYTPAKTPSLPIPSLSPNNQETKQNEHTRHSDLGFDNTEGELIDSSSKKLRDQDKRKDPNQLTLTELCLSIQDHQPSSSSSTLQTDHAPKIEVLNSTSIATTSDINPLEPYEIPEEELESLHPPDQHHSFHPSTNTQPEIDYSIMKDSDMASKPFVYLSQLSDCFKDSSQSYSKLERGLSQAEQLIRRKINWGHELSENAIDLTFAVLNLQDDFELEGFEKYRQRILVSLIMGLPLKVGACLIEQLFYHQYTISQRLTMLNSIIVGILELVHNHNQFGSFDIQSNKQKNGNTGENEYGFKRFQSDHIHQVLLEFQSSSAPMSTSTQNWLGQINKARFIIENDEEENYPKDYYLNQPKPKWISKKLESKRDLSLTNNEPHQKTSLNKQMTFRPDQGSSIQTVTATEIEETFLMLLINRLNWYLDQFNNHSQNHESNTDRNKPFSGAGWMILFEPLILIKIMETLKLLIFLLLDTSATSNNHSESIPSNPKLMEIIKELINLVVRVIKFLLDNHHDLNPNSTTSEAKEEDGSVNDQIIINLSLRLILRVLIYLNVNNQKQDTTSLERRMIMIIKEDKSSPLDSNLKQIRFNQLFHNLFLGIFHHPPAPTSHILDLPLVSLHSIDFVHIFGLISQILDLV